MRKGLYVIGVMVLGFILCAGAQNPEKRYTVAFYNLENLFDTIKSPGVKDEEFTPEGAKNWNSAKYWKKMANIEEVFYKLSADTRAYPTIIGVSEVENRNVLEDIVSLEKLQKVNYQIVHYDSPDARGVDVALLYRPSQFKLEGSAALPVKLADNPDWKTRDVLMVWGTIENEPFYFFVNHWPSRLGGQQQSEHLRMLAAGVVRHAVDSVIAARPDAKIVIMGDLNDDPTDKSVVETLGAKAKMSESKGAGDLFNPFNQMFRKGFGTLAYQDAMNLFDNMIVNGNLVTGGSGKLKLYKPESNRFYGNIYDRPFLRQQSGQYKNYPLRTFVGNNFQGGYSDHFPVFLYIAK